MDKPNQNGIPLFEGFTFTGQKRVAWGEQSHEMCQYCHKKTDMEFILIPAGTHWVCGEAGEETEVELDEYLIGKYPVTQNFYEKFMGDNPSKFRGPHRPVEQVSWYEAREFGQATGLDLPTEAQWEAACRGGTKTRFFWGDEIEGWSNDYCWYYDLSDGETKEVGTKDPNPYGLYDMNGNVEEWCRDWFIPGSFPSSKKNPTGPDSGRKKVYRGGSCQSYQEDCASGSRNSLKPDQSLDFLGFRCVFRPGG